jgi:hypothetical protein
MTELVIHEQQGRRIRSRELSRSVPRAVQIGIDSASVFLAVAAIPCRDSMFGGSNAAG